MKKIGRPKKIFALDYDKPTSHIVFKKIGGHRRREEIEVAFVYNKSAKYYYFVDLTDCPQSLIDHITSWNRIEPFENHISDYDIDHLCSRELIKSIKIIDGNLWFPEKFKQKISRKKVFKQHSVNSKYAELPPDFNNNKHHIW